MRQEMIQQLLEKLAKYFHYEVSEVDVEMWVLVFQDVTEEEFKNAGRAFIKTDAKFMPKAGELYRLVHKEREKRRTKLIPEVGDAVAEVRASIRNYGSKPEYSHPIIDELVNRVGYRRLCENTCEENQRLLTWTFKEMRDNYIDSDREEYTEEAERRLEARKAKEQKRLEARNTGRRYLGAG